MCGGRQVLRWTRGGPGGQLEGPHRDCCCTCRALQAQTAAAERRLRPRRSAGSWAGTGFGRDFGRSVQRVAPAGAGTGNFKQNAGSALLCSGGGGGGGACYTARQARASNTLRWLWEVEGGGTSFLPIGTK